MANRAAIQNPKGLPGRSPGRFGRPGGAATEPHRGDGTLLLVSIVLALGRCIARPIVWPIAAAIGEPYKAVTLSESIHAQGMPQKQCLLLPGEHVEQALMGLHLAHFDDDHKPPETAPK